MRRFDPRAAAAAARADANSAEAGRARAGHARQPAAGRFAQRRQHVGDRRCSSMAAAPGRCLRRQELDKPIEVVRRVTRRAGRPCSGAPGLKSSSAKTSLVGTATPGLTSTAAKLRDRAAAATALRRCRASMRARGSTQTGTSAPILAPRPAAGADRSADSRLARADQPQRRGGIGRAAAKPGRDRQVLVRVKAPSFRPGTISTARARAALQHQIVGDRAGRRGVRAAQR